MSAKGRKKARALLERKVEIKSPSPIHRWFLQNEDAKDFVETWLDMLESGECSPIFSAKRIVQELKENYNYPFSVQSGGFNRWCSNVYGSRFHVAVEQFKRSYS